MGRSTLHSIQPSSGKLKNGRLDHFFGLRILKNERLKALHGFR
jgi:hypothetical protein